ncbi:MAG: hypothetical protein ACTSPB_15770 [Candidatus Thorarchaeota archaeon]
MECTNFAMLELSDTLRVSEKYFTRAEYSGIVNSARKLYEQGNFEQCRKILDTLPTASELFDQLTEKLKGKSVYRTLKKLQEGKGGPEVTPKALSSLLTHIFIECEKGNSEYGLLIPKILEKLNEAVYAVLQRG